MYKIHTVKAIYIKIKEAPNSAVVSPKALVDINFNDKVLQSGTSFDTIWWILFSFSIAQRKLVRSKLHFRLHSFAIMTATERIWDILPENVSSGIFNQVTFKPACSATEAS